MLRAERTCCDAVSRVDSRADFQPRFVAKYSVSASRANIERAPTVAATTTTTLAYRGISRDTSGNYFKRKYVTARACHHRFRAPCETSKLSGINSQAPRSSPTAVVAAMSELF